MKGDLVPRAGHKMFLCKTTPRFTEKITDHMLDKFNIKKSFKALPRWILSMFQSKKTTLPETNIYSSHLKMASVGRSDLLSIFHFGGVRLGLYFSGASQRAVRFSNRVISKRTPWRFRSDPQAANIPRWKVVDGQYVPLKWGDLPKIELRWSVGEKSLFVWGGRPVEKLMRNEDGNGEASKTWVVATQIFLECSPRNLGKMNPF